MKDVNRRDFLKYTGGGIAALVVGSGMPWIFENEAYAAVQVQTLNFRITDAMKQMVTHNIGDAVTPGNNATCYHWIYKSTVPDIPAECPGPNIFCTERDIIQVTVTNDLDEPHNFFIKGVVDSGPIAPGVTRTFRFRAPRGGAYLYYDSLNEPVNRVMGLHGAFIVMPKAPRRGHKFTPYSRPTLAVQRLFDDFGRDLVTGRPTHFPGLAWEEGDPATDTPPFRQYIWLVHEASSRLFADVGNAPAGVDFDATTFVNAFLSDPFRADGLNRKPEYFTLTGQSGHFVHNSSFLCPNNRVGEPIVVHILSAGLQTHSLHIHANHFWVTCLNNVVQTNPLWMDVFTVHPLDTLEYVLPYMRPPDIPNATGRGFSDAPLAVNPTPIPGFGAGIPPGPTDAGVTTWPPRQELSMFIPAQGTLANPLDPASVPIDVQLSPMCYPMHDHSEPSQTSQGGNYNLGMISGINFIGDRNTPGGVTTFPNKPTVHGPSATGLAAGPELAGHGG
jgi:hypothetical protein